MQTDRAVKTAPVVPREKPAVRQPAGVAVETVANTPLEVSLSTCGNPATLRDLMIQSNVGEAQPAFTLSTLELTKPGATLNLIGNARASVAEYLDFAAAWGKANNRPIFMGEFGAYGKADMDSRARWTQFVREETEKRQMTWGYWEFGAGFGVYDRSASVWITPLLNALLPK
ncbi:MAG: glycoside hydrolase family 5 protein [Pleurocapsa sp. SU_196_0]|nr:glycoside hydrolase family 5 protein [Pleurocapsa sp. SU_196_0]